MERGGAIWQGLGHQGRLWCSHRWQREGDLVIVVQHVGKQAAAEPLGRDVDGGRMARAVLRRRERDNELDTGEGAGGQDSAGPMGSEQTQKTSDEDYAAEPVMKIIADSAVRELRTPPSSTKQVLLILVMLVVFATAAFFVLRLFL